MHISKRCHHTEDTIKTKSNSLKFGIPLVILNCSITQKSQLQWILKNDSYINAFKNEKDKFLKKCDQIELDKLWKIFRKSAKG